MKKFGVSKVAPYDYNRICSDEERYNLNNMLLRQVDFPADYYEADSIGTVYSDRSHTEWQEGLKLIGMDNHIRWESVSKKKLIAFANHLFKFSLKQVQIASVTGVRVIRCTNVSSGYPIIVFQAFIKSKDSPEVKLYSSSQNAPNILKREEVKNHYGETVYRTGMNNNGFPIVYWEEEQDDLPE